MEASNPYAPPAAPVRDAPPDTAVFELAGRWTRLGAIFLDGLVSGLLVYVPMVVFVNKEQLHISGGEFNYAAILTAPVLLSGLTGLVVWSAITIRLVARNGQTIAKKLLGIKVVRASGEHAGIGRIFWLRNVVPAVISMIPLAGAIFVLVDYLLIFRQSRQCLHDQIADTIVIRA